MVSVICNAFNHEKYIRETLESFVMQKTNFPFEVLVHDDASTDATPQIIREFEQRYPALIKPIYQTQNQYSQDVLIDVVYQYPRARGKYLAFCEGDDYWTDPLKLQKQVEAMEAHPEVDICAHGASMVEANTKKWIQGIYPAQEDRILSVEEVILGGGGYVATNSLMARNHYSQTLPPFRLFFPIDYAIQIHGALRGGMLYLKEDMSCYRYMADGSWTQRVARARGKHTPFKKKLVEMLRLVDEYTDHAYADTVWTVIRLEEFSILEDEGNYAKMREQPYTALYQNLSLQRKVKLFIKEHMGWALTLFRKLRR